MGKFGYWEHSNRELASQIPQFPYENTSYFENVKELEDCKALLNLVEKSNIFDGLPQDVNTQSIVGDPTSDHDLVGFPDSTVVRHSVPKSISESYFQSSVTFWSPKCEHFGLQNANLSNLEKLVATVKASRLGCKQLESRIKELKVRITDYGLGINGALENDILKIMSGQHLESSLI
ncbi:Hypothetical predicted protein [Paramuricea clavata]|uniref:Uncharacterized protein n=1 Tax=Paramuricea clavata TaxID=317549 RepID=A0A7D9I9Q2_PARCT|nr:Hypothetical predicted protein [Paramuricea clavata]